MRNSVGKALALVLLCVLVSTAYGGKVAIYTGAVSWTSVEAANIQAEICQTRLATAGITDVQIFDNAAQEGDLADWVTAATGNGELDVLILFGWLPSSLYPAGNTQPDGSVIELFLESTDGDAVINHADWMFYVSSPLNGVDGLRNITDMPNIGMGPDNTPMVVTDQGKEIAPNLSNFLSDRPLAIDQLSGDWTVEVALAQNAAGTRADPVIVRDGDRGRIIPAFMTGDPNPQGAVAAEIIAYLMEVEIQPTKLAVSGFSTTVTGTAAKLTVSVADDAGVPTPPTTDVTVNLASSAGTGAFDTEWDGAYDGSVTSVTIPAGTLSTTVYYKDSAPAVVTLTASDAAGTLGEGTMTLNVLEDLSGEPGEVAIYTGRVGWIDKAAADAQAQICMSRLTGAGITTTWFQNDTQETDLAAWVQAATGNGKVDVLVLYGHFPTTIYPAPNTQPDGSIAELFIESTDGDLILNHADYMFYVSSTGNNEVGGLQNMMDNTVISMWGDNTPVSVTPQGRKIAPTLTAFQSDRPFHPNELQGDWFVEAALAEDASGTRADPCLVRDGNRGRLCSAYQTNTEYNPKGAVAAEIIAWIMGTQLTPNQVLLSGPAITVTGTPVELTVGLADDGGVATPPASDVTINLSSDSGTGAFDTAWNGSFDGTLTSVTFPAGELPKATLYYRDTAAGEVTLSATAEGMAEAQLTLTVIQTEPVSPGQVAIYTGATSWITKEDADAQAQICVDALSALGITVTVFSDAAQDADLATWVQEATGNGELDVLILFGYLPSSIYPAGNTEPDGSIIETFIESTDGDAVINHADWMFYVSSPLNGPEGLQNIMDIPGISMAGNDNPMSVTAQGQDIAPSLGDFLSDRPLHINELSGEWFVEAALARSADGALADPVIVRDGNRGRLIPTFMAPDPNPKGQVASEIIAWLMAQAVTEPLFVRGDSNGDGGIDIADAIFTLGYLFAQAETPTCMDTADSNDDGAIDIADAIATLGHLFGGTGPLPAPFEECGPDPTEDDLGCESYEPCE